MNNNKISKDKFVLVNTNMTGINDEPLQTKQVSYLQDALNRFKKNKGSLVAAVIIGIILLFTIFGPFMKNNDKISISDTGRLKYLSPKIPGLEKLGFFDGNKKIERDTEFLESLPEGIVLETYSTGIGSDGKKSYVKVDFYKYTNYINSYKEESGKLMTRLFTEKQYQQALDRNAIIDMHDIINQVDEETGEVTKLYSVRVDLFRYSMNQTTDDTYFWFGTTAKGHDLFLELWSAARVSILLATSVTVINLIIGAIIGAIIGYYGGVADIIFDRIVDILSGLPFIALLTIVVLKYGSSILVILMAFIATGWLGSYSRTRMQFYRFKGREYVLAARTLGAKDGRIMFKHIMPNAIGTLITSFSLAIPSFMFGEATYSYLGIIQYKNTSSIGQLLSEGQAAMQNYSHLLLFPALYISVLMLSFNLMGNGLRDAFNPSLRGAE